MPWLLLGMMLVLFLLLEDSLEFLFQLDMITKEYHLAYVLGA